MANSSPTQPKGLEAALERLEEASRELNLAVQLLAPPAAARGASVSHARLRLVPPEDADNG